MGNPVSIFLAYARADEADRQELEAHLMPLKRSGLVSTWHYGCSKKLEF
ncbi:hypothetical protein [Leptothoe kymatousa]|uniref:TIR domain-containing protein n=1 Tax=Leptothoe kymatousa TAU-MAC 1615 TaxID=2364775 RepID=A0ABS5Y350_9CYAN|nr:hypothetical protein [Leptothoe kymatousa]MBT9311938.1 hypothetical protein [Leptothoe kymatousa TAU-MAC 1615]